MKLRPSALVMEPVSLAYEFAAHPSLRGVPPPSPTYPVLRMPSAFAELFRANWAVYDVDRRRRFLAAASPYKLAYFAPDIIYVAEQVAFLAGEVGTTPAVLLAAYNGTKTIQQLAALFSLAKYDDNDFDPTEAAIVAQFRGELGGRVPSAVARLIASFAPDDYARLRLVSTGFARLSATEADYGARLFAPAYPALGVERRVTEAFPWFASSKADRALQVQRLAGARLAADRAEYDRLRAAMASGSVPVGAIGEIEARLAAVTMLINRVRQRDPLTTETIPTIDMLLQSHYNRQAELAMRAMNAIATHPRMAPLLAPGIGRFSQYSPIAIMDAASITSQRYVDGEFRPPLYRPRNAFQHMRSSPVNDFMLAAELVRPQPGETVAFLDTDAQDDPLDEPPDLAAAPRLGQTSGRLYNGVPTLAGRYYVWAPPTPTAVPKFRVFDVQTGWLVFNLPASTVYATAPLYGPRSIQSNLRPIVIYNRVLVDGAPHHRFESYVVENAGDRFVATDLVEYAEFAAALATYDADMSNEPAAVAAFRTWQAAADTLPRFAARIISASIGIAPADSDFEPESEVAVYEFLTRLSLAGSLRISFALLAVDQALDDALQRSVNLVEPLTRYGPQIEQLIDYDALLTPPWANVEVQALVRNEDRQGVTYGNQIVDSINRTFVGFAGTEAEWIGAGAPGQFTAVDYYQLKFMFLAAVVMRFQLGGVRGGILFMLRTGLTSVDWTAIGTPLAALYRKTVSDARWAVADVMTDSVGFVESPELTEFVASELERVKRAGDETSPRKRAK